MVSKVYSISVNGLSPSIIEVEVDISNGLPCFAIVGLPDQSIQESKDRIRSAFRSAWWRLPGTRITVNLAPADIKKIWPSFDFSIAIWILISSWYIESNELIKESIYIWELALDGKLRRVSGVLPATIWARDAGFKRVFLPVENVEEASYVPDIEIIGISSLKEAINIISKETPFQVSKKMTLENLQVATNDEKIDFKYVVWQEHAKRALEIAAAWGHNIVMSGPPWSWKTMLAKSFAWILPNLTINEALEISKLYSISWLLSQKIPIITKRPFRTVHHTASSVSIVWWWSYAKPWEISLAHKWVLFLDEVLEFQKNVLEVLRQPLEDWTVTISRVNASYTYPSQFILIWAMNPCPCWYLTDPDRECVCNQNSIKRYRSKMSWPLVDRIDMFIEVPKVKTEDFKIWKKRRQWEESKFIKTRVEKARQTQLERYKWTDFTFNSEMWQKELNTYCEINKESEDILKMAVTNMNLSARAYFRTVKLARTIADLEWTKNIEVQHITEALSYRKQEEESSNF